MPPKEKELIQKYRDFSVRFSSRLLSLLVCSEKNDQNFAISPSRLQNVLVLLANWARPQIRKEILECVGNEVNSLKEANVLCIKDRLKITPLIDNYIPIIETSTFLWVKNELDIKSEGLTCVSDAFEVILRRVDFTLPETKRIINKAIDEASHGLIKEINSELDPTTEMILTDILYFKARWEKQFYEEDTKECIFYGTNGEEEIPMMKKTDSFLYREAQTCQIIELPYMCMSEQDKFFTMHIYLPKQDYSFPDVLREIVNDGFCLGLQEEEVKLSLPKFTIESNLDMKNVLVEMGLESILQNRNILPILADDMQIDDIHQKVKIKIDENETEAAALTEVCVVMGGPPGDIVAPIVMNVNRPFMFEIVEEYSNTILFAGIIRNIGNHRNDI